MSPVAVLVGAPGSGKTTVGRLLARALGVEFRDTDDDIVAAAGRPISDLFFDFGEPAFREAERGAVAAALAGHDGVLALGGGAVIAPDTRRALAGHRVVYLDVSAPTAGERVGLARSRPLLLGNVRSQLRALLELRRPFYEEVASVVVDTDGRTPAEVVEEVRLALADLAGPSAAQRAESR